MRPLQIEIRRSPMRWIALLMVTIQIAMMFSRTTEWIGQWPQTTAVAQVGTFLTAAVAAAGCAWVSGRWVRADGEFLQPAGPGVALRAGSYPLIAGLTWSIASDVAGALVAAVTTWRSGLAPSGFLWPNYLALGMISLVIGCALGHLLGLLLPGPAAPPIAALLTILIAYTWTVGSDEGRRESVLLVVSAPADVTLSWAALAARWVLAAGLLAIAATRVPDGLRGPGEASSRVLVAPVVVIALLAASQVGRGGPLVVARPAPEPPACTGQGEVVCVWHEDSKYLLPALEMAKRVHQVSPRFGFSLPDTIYQRGLGPDPTQGFMVNAGPWMIADWIGVHAVVDTVPLCESEDPEAQRRYFAALENLIAFATSVAFDGPQPAEIHSTSPPEDLPAAQDADAWVRHQRQVVTRACG